MATFGRSDTSANNQWYQNTGTNNQVGTRFTAPANGVISALSVYFAMDGATGNAALCLWDTAGALLATSATFTCPTGSTGINGQSLQTHSLVTPYVMTSGTVYIIGFWRDPAATVDYSTDTGSGRTDKQGGTQPSSPGALSLANNITEQLTAYATYSPVALHVRRSGAWVTVTAVKVRRSGAWVDATSVKVRRSGAWVDAT